MEKYLVEIRYIEPNARQWNDESSIEVFVLAEDENSAIRWGDTIGYKYVNDLYINANKEKEFPGAYLGCWINDFSSWEQEWIDNTQVVKYGDYVNTEEI